MVIGIDFGNHACYISVAKQGGIETIYNDYSMRETPSYVGFGARQRVIGVGAKNQLLTNLLRTVFGFKHLLGRKYHDVVVQRILKEFPFGISEGRDGSVMIHLNYLGSKDRSMQLFTPEQITAMLFTKLKVTAEDILQTNVNEAVISCPSYFTNSQRLALRCAGQIAGLKILKIMNDTSAVALAYGIYKQDLPSTSENPRNVVFVDIGHMGIQASACSFNIGKMEIKSTAYATGTGGKAFDDKLANYFATDFKRTTGVDIRNNRKAMLKLTTEVEKVKKQMSANANDLPLNIECLMEDKDLRSSISRKTFEKLIKAELSRLKKILCQCLATTEWQQDEIYSVEVVGGCSRIPAIKEIIKSVFGKTPSTTINADEGISRGCALQCAMLSPSFKVREFVVKDIQIFPIILSWEIDRRVDDMVAFPRFHQIPFIKQITFYRKSDFCISADYCNYRELMERDLEENEEHAYFAQRFSNPFIGSYEIGNIKPGEEGEFRKIKVKIGIDQDGIFDISSAVIIYEAQSADPISTDTTITELDHDNDKNPDNDLPQRLNANEKATTKINETLLNKGKELCSRFLSNLGQEGTRDDKQKNSNRIQLSISRRVAGLVSDLELSRMMDVERRLIFDDTAEKERLAAKNEVEEYIYRIRENAQDVSLFAKDESWLYEDGNDCDLSTYIEKLNELKSYEKKLNNTKSL